MKGRSNPELFLQGADRREVRPLIFFSDRSREGGAGGGGGRGGEGGGRGGEGGEGGEGEEGGGEGGGRAPVELTRIPEWIWHEAAKVFPLIFLEGADWPPSLLKDQS